MRITYLGHAGFRIQSGDHEIAIDPFLTGCPTAPHGPEGLAPSHVILTHGHGDHVGDTETLCREHGATVVSSVEIARWFDAKGVRATGMNIGGGAEMPWGHLRFTPAWHSNSLPDGSYGGMPMGVTLELEGKRLHHAGDTALFSDMRLSGRHGLDLALVPIGDLFTMGPDDAVEAVRLLNPKRVVPIHYDTFPAIGQDAEAFARRVEAETDACCDPVAPGETFEL